jgi:hypothetical protein
MSYRTLEIWQLARDVSVQIHRMSLDSLPKLEMYEEGSQGGKLNHFIQAVERQHQSVHEEDAQYLVDKVQS